MKTRLIASIAVVSALAASLSGFALAEDGHRRDAHLDRLDANKDGIITEGELDNHRATAFTKIASDHNGSLTRAELQAYQQARAAEVRDPAKR